MVHVDDVAGYIIKFFHDSGDLITNLKLQKLLYYVQGWYLGLYGEAVFSQELQAWVHGPVQPQVYQQYKKYAWNPISEDVGAVMLECIIENHIKEVLEEYGGESAWNLERMTHRESPWLEARKNLPKEADSTAVITHQSMQKYFSYLANEKD